MFIEVVTLLRFEIPGAIGELEITNLLTEANGDHKEESGPGDLPGCFLPPGDRELKRTSVTNQCLPGFLRFSKRNKRLIEA